jgi:hypothetical protein
MLENRVSDTCTTHVTLNTINDVVTLVDVKKEGGFCWSNIHNATVINVCEISTLWSLYIVVSLLLHAL